MEQVTIHQTVAQLGEWMKKGGYAKSRIHQFSSTTNQLLQFMDSHEIHEFNTDIGFEFLREHYGFEMSGSIAHVNQARIRDLQMLSEFQLHGTYMPRQRNRNYDIPENFQKATEAFLAYKRFEGIAERNMSTVSLYLERLFSYLSAQAVMQIPQIEPRHIHGFLRFIAGFTNSTKAQTMRTVRQFLTFCFKNGYHPKDLSSYAPNVHHEKRSNIPSTYSYEEVMRLLATVDRSNPIGKRDYAILLLITRLGLRAGDVVNLKYENINWDENRVSLTQHKTGRPLALPLLEDVGLAIIDYLKFGRPICECSHIFVRHSPPIFQCTSSGMYTLVANRLSKAGLLTGKRKHGPHALRHSLASRLLEENVPLPIISEILGHANTNTTAAYLAIDIGKLRQCALEV